MINSNISFSRIYTPREEQAALTLTRAYQKRYLIFFKLFKDKAIRSLNPVQFAHWFNFISKRLIKPINTLNRLRFLVQWVVADKWEDKYALLFSRLGQESSFRPCFTLKKVSDLKGTPSVRGVYYTKELYQNLNVIFGTSLKTKDEVDRLIPLLTDPRVITWNHPEDGCFARADLGGMLLHHSGIENRIFKQYIFGKFHSDWRYHVAIGIAVGTQVYIFDLTLHPTSSLTRQEWIQKCIKDFESKKVVIGKNNDLPDIENHITLLDVPLHAHLASNYQLGDRIQIKMLRERNRARYIALMGKHRLLPNIL